MTHQYCTDTLFVDEEATTTNSFEQFFIDNDMMETPNPISMQLVSNPQIKILLGQLQEHLLMNTMVLKPQR